MNLHEHVGAIEKLFAEKQTIKNNTMKAHYQCNKCCGDVTFCDSCSSRIDEKYARFEEIDLLLQQEDNEFQKQLRAFLKRNVSRILRKHK